MITACCLIKIIDQSCLCSKVILGNGKAFFAEGKVDLALVLPVSHENVTKC